ncbi:hypothetical protein [Chryseobacterium sp. SIMBA_028]|uniref:hypothetical protein n=2 Tax=Bacteria TaxID=2 RepID=UPI003979CEFD
MNIKCDQCKEIFTATPDQIRFISDSQKKGMKFIMLECPSCYGSFSLNPQTMDVPYAVKETDGDCLRCPCNSCYGFISPISDEKAFWGCGECGMVWFIQSDLFDAITDSIQRHPYRSNVYTKKGDHYISVPLKDEPDNYEEIVARE